MDLVLNIIPFTKTYKQVKLEFLAVNKKILDLFSGKEVKALVAQSFLTLRCYGL